MGRPSPAPRARLLRPGQRSDPRVGPSLGSPCLQLLLGPPHAMVATEALRDLRRPGGEGYFLSRIYVYVRVRVCVSECLTGSGAWLTSEPGIYTAPRWRLQFILSERIINLVDRMMYSKHLPVTAEPCPLFGCLAWWGLCYRVFSPRELSTSIVCRFGARRRWAGLGWEWAGVWPHTGGERTASQKGSKRRLPLMDAPRPNPSFLP